MADVTATPTQKQLIDDVIRTETLHNKRRLYGVGGVTRVAAVACPRPSR